MTTYLGYYFIILFQYSLYWIDYMLFFHIYAAKYVLIYISLSNFSAAFLKVFTVYTTPTKFTSNILIFKNSSSILLDRFSIAYIFPRKKKSRSIYTKWSFVGQHIEFFSSLIFSSKNSLLLTFTSIWGTKMSKKFLFKPIMQWFTILISLHKP